MRINFAQFPIYDGIKKEKLIANNITEAYGDWIYKNVAGLKAHLLAEKIFKSTAEGVEIRHLIKAEAADQPVDIARFQPRLKDALLLAALQNVFQNRQGGSIQRLQIP